jgi:hypothetical protein
MLSRFVADTMDTSAISALQKEMGQLKLSLQSVTKQLEKHSQETKAKLNRVLQAVGVSPATPPPQSFYASHNADGNTADDSDSITAADHMQRQHQLAASDTQMPVLERYEVLDTVFSFVGSEEYYYVASVCRNWRGRYLTLCHNTHLRWPDIPYQFRTCCKATVATAARLQLALDNGFTVNVLNTEAYSMICYSLQPLEVMKLARSCGLQFNERFSSCAASSKQYELLRWLLKCGCPCDLDHMIDTALYSDDVEHTKQLHDITAT